MLDADTFSNQNVANYTNQNFITFKINAESKSGVKLFNEFKGNGYPFMVFIDSNNNELERLYGYYPPEDFINKLENINNGINTFSDLHGKYLLGDKSAETMFVLASKASLRGDDSLSMMLYKNVIIHKNVSWDMFHKSKLGLGKIYLKNDRLDIKDYIQEFPESPLIKESVKLLLNYYQSKGMQTEEINLYKNYIDKFIDDPWFLNQFSWRMSELEIDLENALQKINISLDMIIEDKEKRAMILDTKAEIFWKMKRIDDAIITINQSIELDSENSYYQNQKNKYLQSIN